MDLSIKVRSAFDRAADLLEGVRYQQVEVFEHEVGCFDGNGHRQHGVIHKEPKKHPSDKHIVPVNQIWVSIVLGSRPDGSMVRK